MISERDGEWLHQLASTNTVLENLNFYMTELKKVRSEDIELLARRCTSLTSLKISDCDISKLVGIFQAATLLEEFAGGSISEGASAEKLESYSSILFPPKLSRLGLTYLGKEEMPIIYPIASKLKKLDLIYAMLNTEGHCELLRRCPNLEVLEVKYTIFLNFLIISRNPLMVRKCSMKFPCGFGYCMKFPCLLLNKAKSPFFS